MKNKNLIFALALSVASLFPSIWQKSGMGSIHAQCMPMIAVDGNSIVADENNVVGIKLPFWLKAGQTLAKGQNVFSMSVIEFTVNGSALDYSQNLSVTAVQTVPTGKVWKVESIMKDPALPSVAYGTYAYTTPGTYTFTSPACNYQATIKVWSAGGGGGGDNGSNFGGGGGGGGGYSEGVFQLTANTNYVVTVGAGGTGGAAGVAGTAGGSSSVGTVGITATGGGGGAMHTTGTGGAGGIGSGGQINYTGQAGANSSGNSQGARGGDAANGGAGAAGGSGSFTGLPGIAYGGGGSGGGTAGFAGGDGARGKVEITIGNLIAQANGNSSSSSSIAGAASFSSISTYEGAGITWSACASACYNLTENGISDWRIPTFDEAVYYLNTMSPPDGTWITTPSWTATPADVRILTNSTASNWMVVTEDTGDWTSAVCTGSKACRCVR